MAVSFDSSFGIQYANNGYQFIGDTDRPGDAPVLREDQANEVLADNKATFRLHDGMPVGLDGKLLDFPLSAVTSFDGARPLPSVSGPTAAPREVRDRAGYFDVDGSSDAALMWATVMTLAQSSMKDIRDARMMKAVAQEQKIAAKDSEIAATKDKIAHEKDAARDQFITSVVAASVSAAAGAFGGGSGAAGALGGSAAALGTMINSTGTWISTAYGNKAKANEADIQSKQWAKTAEMLDQSVEDKKANLDAAKEQFKAALKLIDDHYEQQTQVVSKIFQG
jgi:hypothetical protein